MPDVTAKIRGKGLDTTGVTEDLASEMYAKKGSYYMAIVEMKVEETHENAEGKRRADLVLTQVEPITSVKGEEFLRDLVKAQYQQRTIGDQATLDGGDGSAGEDPDAVMDRGAALIERDPDGKIVVGPWDGDMSGPI